MKTIPVESNFFTYEKAIKHIQILFGDVKVDFDGECIEELLLKKNKKYSVILTSIRIFLKDGTAVYWPISNYEKEITITQAKEYTQKLLGENIT